MRNAKGKLQLPLTIAAGHQLPPHDPQHPFFNHSIPVVPSCLASKSLAPTNPSPLKMPHSALESLSKQAHHVLHCKQICMSMWEWLSHAPLRDS